MTNLDKSAPSVQEMFSQIAGRYDLLNHLLSANQDVLWRRRAVRRFCPRRGELILDLCCGTGDLGLEILRQQPHCQVIGADFTEAMLHLASIKRERKGAKMPLLAADALQLPLADASYDAVAVGFGVRNFQDTALGLSELYRVLRPGGRLMILEFMRPASTALRQFFAGFNKLSAPLGARISGHQEAYRYLPQSIEGFASRRQFIELLAQQGFSNIRSFEHSSGIATSFLATKPVNA